MNFEIPGVPHLPGRSFFCRMPFHHADHAEPSRTRRPQSEASSREHAGRGAELHAPHPARNPPHHGRTAPGHPRRGRRDQRGAHFLRRSHCRAPRILGPDHDRRQPLRRPARPDRQPRPRRPRPDQDPGRGRRRNRHGLGRLHGADLLPGHHAGLLVCRGASLGPGEAEVRRHHRDEHARLLPPLRRSRLLGGPRAGHGRGGHPGHPGGRHAQPSLSEDLPGLGG